MRGIGEAEIAETVAAGPLERDPVAPAAHCEVADHQPGVVDGHEPIDFPFELPCKQLADTPQIAEPFLAHVGYERDGRLGPDRRLIQRPRNGDQHGQAPAVVADARSSKQVALTRDLDVGSFWKHGVEVRRDHEPRTCRDTWSIGEHVADAIDADALQSGTLEQLFQSGLAPTPGRAEPAPQMRLLLQGLGPL